MTKIQEMLFEMQDVGYKKFHGNLMPDIEADRIIGVRVPDVRKLAARLAGTLEAEEFLHQLPHRYYEENNLHIFLVSRIKEFDRCMEETERFLPYIDNWATCDSFSPKVFARHLPEVKKKAEKWVDSKDTFTIRFGIDILMKYFLDEAFEPEYPEMVAKISSVEYYVNMCRAWYFATALAKQYEAVIPFLEEKRLDRWTHNKTIQKSTESYRISEDEKKYLRTLKIKD